MTVVFFGDGAANTGEPKGACAVGAVVAVIDTAET